MIPTGVQIATLARETFLGELEQPGGQMFTDAVLAGPIGTAYRLLYAQLMRVDDRKARRTSYYNLPAWTTRVTPANMGLANFGSPKELWDRSVGSTWSAEVAAINAATATTPGSVDLTITTHGLSTGAQVVAFNFPGMTADMQDIWHIERVDANTIRLLGCTAEATPVTLANPTTGVGSTGVISNSNEDWPAQPKEQLFDVEPRMNTQSSSIVHWAWKDDAFRFSPCSTARQLRVSHTISGDYGTDLNLSVGIDGCAEYMAAYASGLAANARTGGSDTSAALFTLAVGNPSGDPGDADGGYLGALIRPKVKAQQNVSIQVPRFRPRRNTGWPTGF